MGDSLWEKKAKGCQEPMFLQDSPNMRIRGISGEEQSGIRSRMTEWDCIGENGLGCLKGNFHLRSPSERKRIGGSISERAEDMGNAGKETAVKVKHAQEPLKGREVSRGKVGEDGLNFGGQGTKAIGSDIMAKAINFRDRKCTFGKVNAKAVGGQHIKDLFEVEDVFVLVLAENENVVKVNENEGEGMEMGIHEALESLSSIFETERHEMEFK